MIIGSHKIRLKSVDSTNNYALDLIRTSSGKKKPEGTIIIASEQTAGRGQRENQWISEKDKNLTFSIILYPEFVKVDDQFFISMAISLGIYDCLSSFIDQVKIKWPNDIYVQDKKIAGILIENSIKGELLASSVAGIGINVNQVQFGDIAVSATSVKQITGKDLNLDRSIETLCEKLDHRYLQLKKNMVFELKNDYLKSLYRYNRMHDYQAGDKKFKGRIVDISRTGRLIIETMDNRITAHSFKELTFC